MASINPMLEVDDETTELLNVYYGLTANARFDEPLMTLIELIDSYEMYVIERISSVDRRNGIVAKRDYAMMWNEDPQRSNVKCMRIECVLAKYVMADSRKHVDYFERYSNMPIIAIMTSYAGAYDLRASARMSDICSFLNSVCVDSHRIRDTCN